MALCRWCGKPLRKKYNSRKYHKKCEKEAIQEKNRNRFKKYYKTHIKTNNIQTYNSYKNSLGTGSLSSVPNSNIREELELLQKEKERLKIY